METHPFIIIQSLSFYNSHSNMLSARSPLSERGLHRRVLANMRKEQIREALIDAGDEWPNWRPMNSTAALCGGGATTAAAARITDGGRRPTGAARRRR